MRIKTVLGVGAAVLAPLAAAADDFYQFWGDGRAELSSYRIVQPRYGEARSGYGVMIFVTEDVNRETLIKVESPTPKEERIYTLKLNNILKFTTGIYDYSVMSSVFSAVEPRTQTQPFELLKQNLSSQEWCGHVFEEVRFTDGRLRGELNSYFESEGRTQWSMDRPKDFASEDHLLIRIRELQGPFMAEGESRQLTMLPSLWEFRIAHSPRVLEQATLAKGAPEQITVAGSQRTAIAWTWTYGTHGKTVWVGADYPHHILRWQDTAGGSGELLVSKRLPYWGLHDIDDEPLREELGIPR
ncbi:MAG: hypothetical protein O2782_08430 [bacterium]|nr:hypothetical protein [bacterium]